MKTSTARRLLRDADPARDVSLLGEPAVDDELRAVRRRAQHEAPEAPMPLVQPWRPHRDRTIGFAVPAAVAVVALAVAVALVRGTPAHRSGTGSSTGPSTAASSHPSSPSSRPGPRDPNFAVTVRRVEQILAGAPTLPGSSRAERAPTAVLSGPSSYPADRNLVDRARFWTAPGTMDQAVTYYRKHPPAGMTLGGTGSSQDNAATAARYLTFERPSTRSTEQTVNGAPQPRLSGSVDGQVTGALGLPSQYGQ